MSEPQQAEWRVETVTDEYSYGEPLTYTVSYPGSAEAFWFDSAEEAVKLAIYLNNAANQQDELRALVEEAVPPLRAALDARPGLQDSMTVFWRSWLEKAYTFARSAAVQPAYTLPPGTDIGAGVPLADSATT